MFSNILRRLTRLKHDRYSHLLPKQLVYTVKLATLEPNPKSLNHQSSLKYCSQDDIQFKLSQYDFERICEETLDSLSENLEILLESHPEIKGCDVTHGDGVLTMSLGVHGIYVINRQTPNKQIWLSSPISGPKRYDFIVNLNSWIYKHDNVPLHSLLQKELSEIFKDKVDLSKCSYFVIN